MAGTIADGELTARAASRVRFEVARPEDDVAIRRVLRESAMHGDITITREREPSYFAGTNIAGAEDETVVAFERNEIVGVASCSVRLRYINGVPRRVGYLGELRLTLSAQGRFDVLRRGFQFYAARHKHNPADIYFTSIAADNERSLRFLERGLPGMPHYEFLTEFVTLLVPVQSGVPHQRRRVELNLNEIAECLNSIASRFQFAAHWSVDAIELLEQWGISQSDFCAVTDGKRIVACGAVWDQRAFKQTVVRGYSGRMRMMRPLLNLFPNALRTVSLPPSGSTLSQAYLSPLASPTEDSELCLKLIDAVLGKESARDIEVLTIGFAAGDPRLSKVRARFRCREYRTRLYRVRWPQFDDTVGALDSRLICPEVSLL